MSDKEKDDQEKIIVTDRRLLTEEERQGRVSDRQEGAGDVCKESSPQTDAGGQSTGESSAETEPQKETPPQDINVPTLLRFFIAELSARAWIHMGLLQNPVTKLVVKDAAQARLAIDCTTALVDRLNPELTDEERRQYQSLLNDLRMNFIQQCGA